MNLKTKVITDSKESRYENFKKGEMGYIDGYIIGADDTPLACVIIGERIELIPTKSLKVISEKAYSEYLSTLKPHITKITNNNKYRVAKNGPYFSIERQTIFGWTDISAEFFSNMWDTEKEALDYIEQVLLK